jgi:VanZ family protein
MPSWLAPRPLKWRPLWLAIGWLLVAVVVALSLTPKLPKVAAGIDHADKIGHFLAYFALMSWFGFIYRPSAHAWIALLLVLLGVALEIVQYFTAYRWFSFADMVANALGVMAGFAFARTRFAGTLVLFERRFEH